jgi:hypothetical protein
MSRPFQTLIYIYYKNTIMPIIPGPNNQLVTASAVIPHDYLPNAASPAASFAPTVAINWNTSPTTVQEALDELAARIKALEP